MLALFAASSVAGGCDDGDAPALVKRADVVTIASGNLFSPATAFELDDRQLVSFAVGMRGARLVAVRSELHGSVLDIDTLPWQGVTGATGADAKGTPTLYFSTTSPPGLHSAQIRDGRAEDVVPVTLEGFDGVPFWPQAVRLVDGRVLLALVVPQTRIFVGVDDGTGSRFRMREARVPESDLRGVLAHVGTTNTGAWVLTYQVADAAWHFRSFVLLSTDEGASWTQPRAIESGSSGDVSDPFPLARADGGADVYYVATTRSSTFFGAEVHQSVRRRALGDDGTIGPEELVTSEAVGAVAKPQPRRLHDGRIALGFTVKMSREERSLLLAVLEGDGPR